jgi:hypothetical protein
VGAGDFRASSVSGLRTEVSCAPCARWKAVCDGLLGMLLTTTSRCRLQPEDYRCSSLKDAWSGSGRHKMYRLYLYQTDSGGALTGPCPTGFLRAGLLAARVVRILSAARVQAASAIRAR